MSRIVPKLRVSVQRVSLERLLFLAGKSGSMRSEAVLGVIAEHEVVVERLSFHDIAQRYRHLGVTESP